MAVSAPEITGLLRDWENGDREALNRLMPIVYDELRRAARNYMRRERASRTLQATALVNEVYLRLVDITNVRWQDRAHFFAIAASMMRRILLTQRPPGLPESAVAANCEHPSTSTSCPDARLPASSR